MGGCAAPFQQVKQRLLPRFHHPPVWQDLGSGRSSGKGHVWEGGCASSGGDGSSSGAPAGSRECGHGEGSADPKPNRCQHLFPPQLPSWMTPWSAAEGRGSPSPWPRTASTARPSGRARPGWRWTSSSCCGTASTRRQRPVSTTAASPALLPASSQEVSGTLNL